jgi:NADH-quinone oxidoreductase subunit N
MSYLLLLQSALPEAILVLAAFLILGVDLVWLRDRPRHRRRSVGVWMALAACVLSGLGLFTVAQPASLCGGMLVISPLTQLVKLVLLALTAGAVVLLLDVDFTAHVGEFVGLVLLATTAMMFLVSTEDLLMVFLSIEMLSLCLYVMTAFHKQSPQGAEAGLKYFLFGGVAAGCLLFGLSLLYGISGHTNLRLMAVTLGGRPLEPVFFLALVMTVVGFGFKIAAVPFHLWVADVYQGAPLPAAAFIASGSKVASFFILARLVMVGLAGAEGNAAPDRFLSGWVPLLACLAALSMVLGNLAALAQQSVRRLLAFSAVAQAGYVLVGLLAGGAAALSSVLYYTTTYGLTLVGAFAVVGWVESRTGSDNLEAFAGLSRRAPAMAFCLMVFVLSLAGIPPLAGFFGKFYLFTAALNSAPQNLGLLWLVALAVAMSALSLYYYLQVLKQAYVAEPPAAAGIMDAPWATRAVVCLLAGLAVVMGSLPDLLLRPLLAAIRLSVQ